MELYRRRKKLDGLTDQDIAAIQAASAPAGEYLESIGKTDLATMTETEWMTLLECIYCTALDKLAELSLDNIPFPELVTKAEKGFKRK